MITGLNSEVIQSRINEQIAGLVFSMMLAQGSQDVEPVNIEGTYTTELNEKSLLSIRFENFAIREKAANGTTLLKAVTFDLNTGEFYQFYDLFSQERPYRIIINNMLEAQIKQKELPTFGAFPGVKDNQPFYLMPTSVVIIFPELLFTPHVIGPPEFKLPFKQIQGLINTAGPIARLIPILQ
ncbi:MAG: DUF3298 domain-containing protein [Firmicutes bacterium]|nr:DUF3298 domain-containing protein [Bacillota bacterium]